MNAPSDLAHLTPQLEGRVSAEEWQARLDLAAAYRLVALFRWDDLVFKIGRASCRERVCT